MTSEISRVLALVLGWIKIFCLVPHSINLDIYNVVSIWSVPFLCIPVSGQVFIPIPKKGNAKECSNYCKIALISHTSKVMLKILQVKLQQYVNWEVPDVQARFKRGRGTRGQIANVRWIIEKAKEFQKNIYFCFIDYAKAFDSVDKNKLWKILKEMGILTLPATCEICIQVKKQQLEPWNNRLFPNWERSTSRMYIAYLTYMQNTSWKCWCGWNTSWNQDCQKKYQ